MRRMMGEETERFRDYLMQEERSKATLEKYIRDISAFAAWADGREVTKELVLEYKNLLAGGYALSSVNSILSALNSFFSCLGWEDCKVKTVRLQRQVFRPAQSELSKEEYERLLQTAKDTRRRRLYLLMQTICSTGIRVSELKFITVAALREGKAVIHCKGKVRVVILPARLCCILRQYVRQQAIRKGSVFVSRNGNPLDRSNIWSDMKRLCERAGVAREKVFPHNLRHLFARTYYSMQKDIVRLADILGHSSINTTRIYTMESGEIHRRQIQRLGLLRC